jgi:hypothetical protein
MSAAADDDDDDGDYLFLSKALVLIIQKSNLYIF